MGLPSSVTIIGCEGLDEGLALPIAKKLLYTLSQAWPLDTVFTIKEDTLGKLIRRECTKYNYRRLGVAVCDQDYSDDAAAVAVSRIIWRVPRVIVYWDGKKGLPRDCIEVCQRMRKPFKMFEV